MATFASRIPRANLRVTAHRRTGALPRRRFGWCGRLDHTLNARQRQLSNARHLPLLLVIERSIHHNGDVSRLAAPQRRVGPQVTADRCVGPAGRTRLSGHAIVATASTACHLLAAGVQATEVQVSASMDEQNIHAARVEVA